MTNVAGSQPGRVMRNYRGGICVVLAVVFVYQWRADVGGMAFLKWGPSAAYADGKPQADRPIVKPVTVVTPPPRATLAAAAVPATPDLTKSEFAAMLRQKPIDALRDALRRHERNVREYSCTFIKQELLPGGMSAEQQIDVKFREKPYSVLMHWTKNADQAVRVIYVADKWIDNAAATPAERDLAVCQPGAIAQIFVKSVKQPIRGARAKKASRRFIDSFGFTNALSMMITASEAAAKRNQLTIRMDGEGQFDGRPTWILYRELPYPDANGDYPDGACTYHIDQEWRVPVAVYSYADKAKKQLLGKYEYKNIRMNPNLADRDFEPATYGM